MVYLTIAVIAHLDGLNGYFCTRGDKVYIHILRCKVIRSKDIYLNISIS